MVRFGSPPGHIVTVSLHPIPKIDGIALTILEGSGVIFDCTLVHKGGGNRSEGPRRAIFPTYKYYWMKRFETWMPYSTLGRFPDAAPEMQQLLGIQLHEGSDYSGFGETRIMRKNLDGAWEWLGEYTSLDVHWSRSSRVQIQI